MNLNPSHIPANVERFSGFAEAYDAHRPQPPVALLDILTQQAQIQLPRQVTDLGSGTGLSTFIWADRAREVVGIEPNPDMIRMALRRAAERAISGNVHFKNAYASDTELPDACSDIVTCSQSLHWMEPASTLAEVGRILRKGGIFAAYDCDWPPTMNWEAEAAYESFVTAAEALGERQGLYRDVKKWPKEGHIERIRDSNLFRYVKEIVIHHVERGNDERLVGMALSQGGVASLLKKGLSDGDIGLDQFRRVAKRTLGNKPITWYFSYRIRMGVR
jgi:ubiquinone/menaquinone biosynthesis C-methylase UbiE